MGNHGLYILCKGNGEKLSVGLWNISSDVIEKPVIVTDREYKGMDAYNCMGNIEKREVQLAEPINPYEFVCFTLE